MLLRICSFVDPQNVWPCGLCVRQSLFSSLFLNDAEKILCQGFVNFNNINNSNKKNCFTLHFCVQQQRLLNRTRLNTFVNHIMCFSIWIFIRDSLRFLFQGRLACQPKKKKKVSWNVSSIRGIFSRIVVEPNFKQSYVALYLCMNWTDTSVVLCRSQYLYMCSLCKNERKYFRKCIRMGDIMRRKRNVAPRHLTFHAFIHHR